MEIKTLLALLSILMTLTGYAFYFKDIFANRTHPHAFSWLVWGLLTAIAFVGQITHGGKAGAWVTFVTAAVSFIIFFFALSPRGEKSITNTDKLSLVGAAIAAALWAITSNALIAIVLVTIIDFLGFLPTIRKSYNKPYEETLIHYIFAGLKFIPAIIALGNYSLITVLYPASLVAANLFFALMLVIRRSQVTHIHS